MLRMGSHPWKTVTSYDADLAAALARAQREVFDRGEYGFKHKMKSLMELMGAAELPELPELPDEPQASSIEEARELAAEEGTCSVLDAYELGDAPAPGVAGPFDPSVLEGALGSVRPTLAEAQAGLGQLYERLDRGEAAYVVCYENGLPAHYLFIGMSFD
jgi:hypothetical protein